jgi:hypothetical protein
MVREFLIAGGDTAVALDPGEEVFDGVALAVESAAEPTGPAAPRPGWDAGVHALLVQALAEGVGIEPAIGQQPAVAQTRQQRPTGEQVMLRSGRQRQFHGSSQGIDRRSYLGIEATFGPAHGLGRLAAGGVGPVGVHLDVRAVQTADLAPSVGTQAPKQPRPQAALAPATEPRVDRTPWAESRGQVPPRYTGAQDIPHRRHHQPIILGRPSPATVPFCPKAKSASAQVNFFSRSHNGSGSSQRSVVVIALRRRATSKVSYR